MQRTGRQPIASSPAPTADVLGHLEESVRSQWRRYRKRLRRCQDRFSEEAVHDARVETRRLLATLELLRAFLPEKDLKRTLRSLKVHLDTFDKLRDTQVQLAYVRRFRRAFPLARSFAKWLSRREARFTRSTRRDVRRIKTRRLALRIRDIEKDVRRLRRATPGARAYATALAGIGQAFDRVARCCRRVSAADTTTIHRVRIAFKRFRYMIEAIHPLLPRVTDEHRRAMHGYQSMMGDIQDVEVLLAALAKFNRNEAIDGRSVRPLREELLRRRRWLIEVYLNGAGKLRQFWPPGDLRRRAGGRRARARHAHRPA
jgi:CHAD domain-containing protein